MGDHRHTVFTEPIDKSLEQYTWSVKVISQIGGYDDYIGVASSAHELISKDNGYSWNSYGRYRQLYNGGESLHEYGTRKFAEGDTVSVKLDQKEGTIEYFL